MRILHVISSGGLFGAERVLLSLTNLLPDVDARIALFRKANGAHEPLQRAAEAHDLEVHLLDDRTVKPFRAIRELRDLINIHCIDTVQSHGYKANVLAMVAVSKMPHVGLICTEHGFTDKSFKSEVYGVIDRMSLRSPAVSRIVCVSDAIHERCLKAGAPPDKIVKMDNPAPPVVNNALPLAARDIDFLFLGRLSIEKGADILIDAIALIGPARVVIAGTGPEDDHLRGRVREKGVCSNIEFVGFCAEPATLLSRAKWLVLPSRTEGMPLALLEALANGTPAIATNVGEIGALYQRACWGYLIPSDNVHSLATALRDGLVVTSSEWNAYAAEAQRIIGADYDVVTWTEKWRALYDDAKLLRAIA